MSLADNDDYPITISVEAPYEDCLLYEWALSWNRPLPFHSLFIDWNPLLTTIFWIALVNSRTACWAPRIHLLRCLVSVIFSGQQHVLSRSSFAIFSREFVLWFQHRPLWVSPAHWICTRLMFASAAVFSWILHNIAFLCRFWRPRGFSPIHSGSKRCHVMSSQHLMEPFRNGPRIGWIYRASLWSERWGCALSRPCYHWWIRSVYSITKHVVFSAELRRPWQGALISALNPYLLPLRISSYRNFCTISLLRQSKFAASALIHLALAWITLPP